MKKIKNFILGISIMILPIIASAIAEIISNFITMESIMTIVYISIPVSLGILIKWGIKTND